MAECTCAQQGKTCEMHEEMAKQMLEEMLQLRKEAERRLNGNGDCE